MKRLFFLSIVSLVALESCKLDSKASEVEASETASQIDVSSAIETLSGELIFSDTIAVLKKENLIYGVEMNAKAKYLIAEAKQLNKDPFSSFDVILEADIKDNPEENAWPQIIDIQTIINIKPSSEDDSLRLYKQE